jgi:hypothetical protein
VDDSGRVVLGRDYRGDVGAVRINAFCEAHLRRGGGALARGDAPPIQLFDGSSFVLRRLRGGGGLWMVGATNANVNAALCVALLAQLECVFVAYFADEPLTASALRGKAALVFALLDEVRRRGAAMRHRVAYADHRRWRLPPARQVMDYGMPQVLEPALLRQYIVSKGAGGPGASTAARRGVSADISLEVTGTVPWRPRGVTHARNQLFLDCVERVDAVLSPAGELLAGEVHGAVHMDARLSGMPTCMLAFNDLLRGAGGAEAGGFTPGAPERYAPAPGPARRAEIADSFSFHQCVRLRSLQDSGREVLFVPPDGKFQLVAYRSSEGVRPPVKVISSCLQHGRARVELIVLVRADVPPGTIAYDIRVRLPVPKVRRHLA